MEKDAINTEVYDYRKYDRIWKRVSPELNPYPEIRDAAGRQDADAPELCCMAGSTPEMEALLGRSIDDELSDRCAYLTYARCAPSYARRRLQMMAADEERHARRLMTVYYLTTGRCYRAAVPDCRCTGLPWCQLLRQLYHRENCGARHYEEGAENMEDFCLREIFLELAADERCHARQILQLLEKTTLA
ncbi:MAG: ferritin-like domain-containing protein [Clostridiales bacterium]|nr:ferritin-like domain-containing protein [Candidatus Cacconaster stercorequi]